MRARAKVIRATMPDPAPMLDHFERHFRRAIRARQAHADRVVVVRQSWYDKETLTPEEAAHMWHGGVGQAWREEVTTYYSIDVMAALMALLDARAAPIAQATRRRAGRSDAGARAEPRHLLRLLPPDAVRRQVGRGRVARTLIAARPADNGSPRHVWICGPPDARPGITRDELACSRAA